MRKKNVKKNLCDGDCQICNNIKCHLYNPYPCYGKKCDKCDNPCQLQNAGINVIREKKQERMRTSNNRKEVAEFDDNIENQFNYLSEKEQITLVCAIRLDTIRKIADMYFSSPVTFDATMREIYLGENHSAFAKSSGVTRQAISKAIRTENGERYRREISNLKKQNSALNKMTATELKVFQLCGRGGILTISSVAKQAGLSRTTVYNTLHNLSEKYGICFTLDKSQNRKI